MAVRRILATLTTAIALTAGVSAIAAAPQDRAVTTSQDKSLPASLGDLGKSQLIEIRDQSGQVLLQGTLATSRNTPKKMERKADLTSPTGQKARGDVDVTIQLKDGVATKDEVEIDIENLPSMTNLQLFIDGQTAASFVTSKAGKAELKFDRKTTAPNR